MLWILVCAMSMFGGWYGTRFLEPRIGKAKSLGILIGILLLGFVAIGLSIIGLLALDFCGFEYLRRERIAK